MIYHQKLKYIQIFGNYLPSSSTCVANLDSHGIQRNGDAIKFQEHGLLKLHHGLWHFCEMQLSRLFICPKPSGMFEMHCFNRGKYFHGAEVLKCHAGDRKILLNLTPIHNNHQIYFTKKTYWCTFATTRLIKMDINWGINQYLYFLEIGHHLIG
jgi:hypothetical protein